MDYSLKDRAIKYMPELKPEQNKQDYEDGYWFGFLTAKQHDIWYHCSSKLPDKSDKYLVVAFPNRTPYLAMYDTASKEWTRCDNYSITFPGVWTYCPKFDDNSIIF